MRVPHAGRIGLVAFVAFMTAALLVPAAQVVRVSLIGEIGSYSLENYSDVLGSGYFLSALWQTLTFCLSTSVAASLLALPAAWRIGRGGPGSLLLRGFCQANYAFGGVIYGMLAVALIGNVGLVPLAEYALFGTETTRGLVYTLGGLVIAYFGFQIPRSALLLAQAVEKLDPDLLRASKTLGASPAQTALFVTIPLLRASIVSTILSTFLISIASFGVALLVTQKFPIFGALIFKEFIGFVSFGSASAMAVVLAASSIVVAILLRLVSEDRNVVGF